MLLQWSDDDQLTLQLARLEENPLNDLSDWMCRAWDTLMILCSVKTTTIKRRAGLKTWHKTIEGTQRKLLQKRYGAKPCARCNKKLWNCRHDPFDPMNESLDATVTVTRKCMQDALMTINYMRQVCAMKVWKLSDYHFHKKLLRLFEGCNENYVGCSVYKKL
jgi:hypothetical protein